jgi:hypothetical protein
LDVLRRVEDRAVAVKRRRAEARMAEARGLLTGVGADLVSPESVRAIRQAGEALAAAAAEGVDVPGLAALSASGAAVAERSRAAVADAAAQAERVAQQAADQQVATDQITRARTMLAAGDLDAAASAVAQAQDRWAAVPGLLIVQAQVATAMEQRRVERARDARRQQAVATADASMESARAAKVRLRAAEDARGRAEVRRDEGRSSLALEQEIWAASRDADAARAEVEGALAAAWQAIRDEDIPLRLQIKGAWSSWLADGLRAASAERNTVLMASLSSRLADVDPDSYLRLRQGRGGLAAKMPGAWTVRPLAARWGDASTSAAMAWDGMGLDLPQGRYEVSCDGSTGIVFVAAGATQSVAAPTTPPPAMTGFSWRWIPTAEVWMSETEVTHAAYAAYVQDPEVWRNVTASWKRIRTGKAEVDEPLAALPRRQSRDEETWQVYVDGESGELLTKVEVPAALRPRPVTGVSRIDAVGFCRWLEGKIQRRVLLPSRSQWLAAATGGDPERAYPWGPIFDPDAVGGLGGTACRAVGTSPGDIGPFGHRDLGGNVREWIMARGRVLNATIAGGGFADTDRERFRATAFEDIDERTPHAMIGFRLVIP